MSTRPLCQVQEFPFPSFKTTSLFAAHLEISIPSGAIPPHKPFHTIQIMPKKSNTSRQSRSPHKMEPASKVNSEHSYADVAQHSSHGIPSPPHSTIDDDKERLQQQGHELVGRAIESYPAGKSYATGIDEVPITLERSPYIPGDHDPLLDPGTARATMAASKEAPNGTVHGGWTKNHQDKTVSLAADIPTISHHHFAAPPISAHPLTISSPQVVQQHVAYWDTDNDGVIWPWDTYIGCRRWGWSPPLALLTAFLIHFNLSYATVRGLLPDPFFRIYVARMHKNKHGSDSMSFDNEGRFRPQNFEDLFAKYDRDGKGGLDAWDLLRAWKGQRMAFDFFGTTAAFLECECSPDLSFPWFGTN